VHRAGPLVRSRFTQLHVRRFDLQLRQCRLALPGLLPAGSADHGDGVRLAAKLQLPGRGLRLRRHEVGVSVKPLQIRLASATFGNPTFHARDEIEIW
jgi:hypothetical protein